MSLRSSESDLSGLIEQLNNLNHSEVREEATRRALYDATSRLSLALETPGDLFQRVLHSPIQLVTARLATDLNLFEILSERRGTSLSTDEFAKLTNANKDLLGRVLRYLTSYGMIQEVTEDFWTASEITKAFSVPGLRAGLKFYHKILMPCYYALPEFLAETKYQNPNNNLMCAFQKAYDTDLPPFIWLQDKPSDRDDFSLWMGASREGQNNFLDVFPFEKEIGQNTSPETVLFVDVGGSIGHQCLALKKKLPKTPGRIILQDLPTVLQYAVPAQAFEPMAHDFTMEQPVKGARAYYLRNIMHDYPEEKCVLILQQIVKAMDADSVILIDDMIIPRQDASWRATQIDLTMMASLAGVERTEKQWHVLLEKAGLKVRQICTYTPGLRDSIIVAVPR